MHLLEVIIYANGNLLISENNKIYFKCFRDFPALMKFHILKICSNSVVLVMVCRAVETPLELVTDIFIQKS